MRFEQQNEGMITMNSKKIRIVHIAQAAGGVDRYIRLLLKYLNKSKYENILICSQDFEKEDYNGLVTCFEQIEMQRSIGVADVLAAIKLRSLIKKYHPDIIYAHSSKAGAVARLANIGLGHPCVYNPHGWAFNMRCSAKKKWMYKTIERTLSHFCNKIICISQEEKETAIEGRICSGEKLQVILNGIDIEGYEANDQMPLARKDLGIPENAFVVGMVGRMTPQKAPDTFIKAATQIKTIIPEAFFIIVGNGEQESLVCQIAKKHGILDSLLITGWVTDPMSYIKEFNVATLFSRWEGFGLVLAEYMLARKPIVATRVDAIPEIIEDHVNGLLVGVDNIKEITDAVLEIYNDIDLRDDIVENGYKIVHNRYDVKRVAEQHEELFSSVL
ncbi:MAG: glycosyltransferase family 4 protein [Lachnospiraceae bacterium]|nr:glycosyltransferase family 4 protein [Lachnospiraceae bacterium]